MNSIAKITLEHLTNIAHNRVMTRTSTMCATYDRLIELEDTHATTN